ncbi:MAG: choice-of-anchor J domain-containing protein [Dinghuibacter sp.]|nr:choice-of-anchor J domain-containing protein [Dinghuibacter sp.]
MRKITLHNFFFTGLLSLFALFMLPSCKDDSYLLQPEPVPDQSFAEEFDSASAALSRGWKFINNSYPAGGNVWQNGGSAYPVFEPFSQRGQYAGFVGATYESTSAAAGVISNWLVSPPVIMQNGDKIVFYTRSQLVQQSATPLDSTDFANRLQVRINTHGTDYYMGDVKPLYEWSLTPSPTPAPDDPGNYDITLVEINPDQLEYHTSAVGATTATSLIDGRVYNQTTNLKAYPHRWTRYEATVRSLSKPTMGRFAFRYFVIGAGSNGFGTAVGIDKVDYISVSKK